MENFSNWFIKLNLGGKSASEVQTSECLPGHRRYRRRGWRAPKVCEGKSFQIPSHQEDIGRLQGRRRCNHWSMDRGACAVFHRYMRVDILVSYPRGEGYTRVQGGHNVQLRVWETVAQRSMFPAKSVAGEVYLISNNGLDLFGDNI